MAASLSKIRLGRVDGASKEQRRRLVGVVDDFRRISDVVGLHRDTEIEVIYTPAEESDKWYMKVDPNRGQYMKWKVEVSQFCLEKDRDGVRAADVVHECLHMLLYDYTSIAILSCGKRFEEVLQEREETVVTHLEHAICRALGIEWI